MDRYTAEARGRTRAQHAERPHRSSSPRYEGAPCNYLALLGLATTLCCYKRLVRLTT
ncbi:hypothetical protein GCM10009753_03830 [Streptantibioticus ferralitis]